MAPQSPDPVLEVRLISRPPVIIQAEAEGLLPRLTQYSPTADSLDSNAQAWSAQVTQLRPPEPREVWQRPSPPPPASLSQADQPDEAQVFSFSHRVTHPFERAHCGPWFCVRSIQILPCPTIQPP